MRLQRFHAAKPFLSHRSPLATGPETVSDLPIGKQGRPRAGALTGAELFRSALAGSGEALRCPGQGTEAVDPLVRLPMNDECRRSVTVLRENCSRGMAGGECQAQVCVDSCDVRRLRCFSLNDVDALSGCSDRHRGIRHTAGEGLAVAPGTARCPSGLWVCVVHSRLAHCGSPTRRFRE